METDAAFTICPLLLGDLAGVRPKPGEGNPTVNTEGQDRVKRAITPEQIEPEQYGILHSTQIWKVNLRGEKYTLRERKRESLPQKSVNRM